MEYLLIVIGFAVLTIGADALVNGASAIAKKMNVSNLVIGLTVVAFGTSTPELVVNIVAAFNGNSEIALTNILGSNAINTYIILGLSAIVYPLAAQKSTIRVDVPLSILAGVIVLLLGTNFFTLKGAETGISRIDGIILLIVFGLFLYHSFRVGKEEGNNSEDSKPLKMRWAVLLVLSGLSGLILGGELIVRSAVKIAKEWGVSDALIGVTIVALGTSLPELATSVVAAFKKNVDLAIGNVIGSNIFNVFFVLGLSSVIRPLSGYPNLWIDASFAAFSSVLVFLFLLGKKQNINRWQGGLLLLIYAAYLTWLICSL